VVEGREHGRRESRLELREEAKTRLEGVGSAENCVRCKRRTFRFKLQDIMQKYKLLNIPYHTDSRLIYKLSSYKLQILFISHVNSLINVLMTELPSLSHIRLFKMSSLSSNKAFSVCTRN
jgi:hypothetical protein